MALFTKGIIGAGIAGTITLGALVTWNGGDTIDEAQLKLDEQANALETFASNEDALINKISDVKGQVATLEADKLDLQAQIDDLRENGNEADQTRIAELEEEIESLEGQITDKQAEITTMETTIATLETDLENSAGNTDEVTERINELEAELESANIDAEELQAQLDEMGEVPTSDQAAVDAALATSEDDEGEEDPIEEETPAFDIQVNMLTGLPKPVNDELIFNTSNNNEDELIITNEDFRDYTIVLEDGTSITLAGGVETVIGLKSELDGTTATLDGETILFKNQ